MRKPAPQAHPTLQARPAGIEARLEEQLRFERLISELSARFVRTPNDQLDREIVLALDQLREFFRCDRCGVIGLGTEEGRFHVSHLSQAEGIPPFPEGIDYRRVFPWSYEMYFRRGEPIVFTRLDDLPEESRVDHEGARLLGVKSNLGVPLFSGEAARHAIIFQSLREERSWPDSVVQRVRLVGEIFLNAIERRRADETLRESEERVHLAAEAAGAGFWILDPAGEQFWVTPKVRELFRIPEGEPVTVQRIFAVIHPEDRSRARRAMEASFSTADTSGVEYRVVRPGGQLDWLASRGRVLSEASSSTPRLMGVTYDITARKRMEEAALLAEQEFRTMFELSAVGMAQVDPGTGRFLRANAKYCEITGYTEEELRGLTNRDLTHPDDAPHDSVQYGRVLAGLERTWSTQKRYVCKDGSTRWVEVNGTVVRGNGDRPLRSMAVILDLTESRRAQNDANLLREELAHLGRVATLGELTASLAHELNQPLTAIQSNAQTAQLLLERGGVAAGELTDILQDIVSDNRRASEIIRRLRAALKKQAPEMQSLGLQELIQEVTALVLPDILRSDALLALDLEGGLPPVRGDKIQLQQVLVNLMVNALDAMADREGGRLVVRCTAPSPGEVRLSVEDSGPGIAPDRLEGIFDPFYTSKPQGLGMGLAICRSIARAHGGRLWAENRPEGGAAFHLTLSAAPPEE